MRPFEAVAKWGRQFLNRAMTLFQKRGQSRETFIDQRVEERWDADYRNKFTINFTEIFANRLSNYTMSGSTVSCDDETVDNLLYTVWARSAKWLPLALGVGRVYMVPYIVGDKIYTDYIPQSAVITTDFEGDMLTGFVCVADIKSIGNRKYARLVQHQYDGNAKTYTVINKAVSQNEQGFGGELPLSVIKEWADIEPEITFTGVDQIPFGYVDSPKDNRNADKLQGASITFGCEGTIAEIHETIRQYMIEFDHKRSVLGVDRSMLDPEAMRLNGGHAAIAQEHILTETVGKLGTGTSDLFSVYSPDIRDQAYRDRLLHLFARLEKQVGTSSGILTPADTSMATATQVRRAMYDTWAMVGRMRASIEACMHSVAYGYYVMLSVVGTPVQEYTLTFDWSDDLLTDSAEQFTQISQGHSAGVVSDVEYRRFFYPNESPEEAQKALDEINKNKPEPFDIFSPEPFGDESGVIE